MTNSSDESDTDGGNLVVAYHVPSDSKKAIRQYDKSPVVRSIVDFIVRQSDDLDDRDAMTVLSGEHRAVYELPANLVVGPSHDRELERVAWPDNVLTRRSVTGVDL